MVIIGIDNGVSGWIAILADGQVRCFLPMPVKKELNYTKTKQFLKRVDIVKFLNILFENVPADSDVIAVWERPMVNPMRFKASVSAIRCLEATLVCLESCRVPFQYIDSKEWQRTMLPSGLRKEELKQASDSVAKRLFPELAEQIKNGNGDALLIAKYHSQKEETE